MPNRTPRPSDEKSQYSFSYDELRDFLVFLKGQGDIGSMRDVRSGKYIILRQDIDMDFYPSFEVMKMQLELDIRSTFFVLLTSPTYNPQAPGIREKLREMSVNGYEIGLHFDPSVYRNASEERIIECAKAECRILEDITGEKVNSISLHNPSVSGQYPIFNGYKNAYSKELFADNRYISDSMRVDPSAHPFRGKNPYEFVRNATEFPLQIVLHPEQFLKAGGNYTDSIERYISETRDHLAGEYQHTLETIRRNRLYNLK